MAHQFVEAPPLNAPNLLAPKPTNEAVKPPMPVTPKEAPKETPKVETPTVTSADILKRGSTPVETPAPTETSYREDLEKITDPTVRALAEKQLKDLEAGYNKKFQTLAEQRKQLESLQSKISTWTPQRLSEELRKPEFIQAMQILQQQAPPSTFEGSAEEWSGLNDTEKQRILANERETQSLRAQMDRMLQAQEDVQIKNLYPEYDPRIVDEAIEGLRSGQVTASRVDIWKVVNHDKNVEKGYQFGYEDGYKKALEKLNGSTPLNGNLSVKSTEGPPEEVRKGGFSSIALWNLNNAKNGAKK